MSAEDEDVKPNNEGSEPITIRVRDQVGRWRSVLYFILKRDLFTLSYVTLPVITMRISFHL
jgi:hypothetical protein